MAKTTIAACIAEALDKARIKRAILAALDATKLPTRDKRDVIADLVVAYDMPC